MQRLVAPLISGQYDYVTVPILLPTPLVNSLLPENISPAPSESGLSWIVLQIGQIHNMPISFYETKLQIPFIKIHDQITTYKARVLMSNRLMSSSAKHITGLSASYENFKVEKGEIGCHFTRYQVVDWLTLAATDDGEGMRLEEWSIEKVKIEAAAWWSAKNSGSTYSRFIISDLRSPRAGPFNLSINLLKWFPHFSLEKMHELIKPFTTNGERRFNVDEDGWLTCSTNAWQLHVQLQMQSRSLA